MSKAMASAAAKVELSEVLDPLESAVAARQLDYIQAQADTALATRTYEERKADASSQTHAFLRRQARIRVASWRDKVAEAELAEETAQKALLSAERARWEARLPGVKAAHQAALIPLLEALQVVRARALELQAIAQKAGVKPIARASIAPASSPIPSITAPLLFDVDRWIGVVTKLQG
jgi:hypothetical protein